MPNYFVPVLLTLPLLCAGGGWEPVLPFGRGGLGALPAVLSSGVAGAGFPGLGGWATVWAFGPSIIPLATSVQIVLGAALTYWLFVPLAFFGGDPSPDPDPNPSPSPNPNPNPNPNSNPDQGSSVACSRGLSRARRP